MSEHSVAGLRSVADKVIEEIGKAQGALSLARDRAQSAQDMLRIGLDDASSDQAAAAQAALTQLDTEIDDGLKTSMIAVDQVAAWTVTL